MDHPLHRSAHCEGRASLRGSAPDSRPAVSPVEVDAAPNDEIFQSAEQVRTKVAASHSSSRISTGKKFAGYTNTRGNQTTRAQQRGADVRSLPSLRLAFLQQ